MKKTCGCVAQGALRRHLAYFHWPSVVCLRVETFDRSIAPCDHITEYRYDAISLALRQLPRETIACGHTSPHYC